LKKTEEKCAKFESAILEIEAENDEIAKENEELRHCSVLF